MRKVHESPYFKKSCRRVSQEVVEGIKRWAETVLRVQTPRNNPYFKSPNIKFEIWVAGIPNKDARRGRSGGFRLVYFYVFEEGKEDLYLDLLEGRKQIGFKKERPKDKEKFEKHLRGLKKELMETLES